MSCSGTAQALAWIAWLMMMVVFTIFIALFEKPFTARLKIMTFFGQAMGLLLGSVPNVSCQRDLCLRYEAICCCGWAQIPKEVGALFGLANLSFDFACLGDFGFHSRWLMAVLRAPILLAMLAVVFVLELLISKR